MSKFRRKSKPEVVAEPEVIEPVADEVVEAAAPEPAPVELPPEPSVKSEPVKPAAPVKEKAVGVFGSGGVFRSIGGGRRIKL